MEKRKEIEVYFSDDDNIFENINIKRVNDYFTIELYDRYECSTVYEITKEKMIELRDKLNEILK